MRTLQGQSRPRANERNEVNTDIKAKWIAALRSGEYKQGIGCLHESDEYCCLGVLCDLHAKATRNDWNGDLYLGEGYTLPSPVQKWAGLRGEVPEVGEDSIALTVYNDGRSKEDAANFCLPEVEPKTFPEIADLIEKHL